jgi:hypothetical protein
MHKLSVAPSFLLGIFYLLGTVSAGEVWTVNFEQDEVGKLPAGFITARTGEGGEVKWVVAEDATSPAGKNVLVQLSKDDTGNRYPLCIYQKIDLQTVTATVRFKTVSGEVDQAAGIVVRYKDKDNYYVVRANALEDNVRFYKVEGGKRKQLAGVDVKVPKGGWQKLTIIAERSKFIVRLNGKNLFETEDKTFTAAGKVGLWTKADSVTQFDELVIMSD